jgi:hypothetical protein
MIMTMVGMLYLNPSGPVYSAAERKKEKSRHAKN